MVPYSNKGILLDVIKFRGALSGHLGLPPSFLRTYNYYVFADVYLATNNFIIQINSFLLNK
jgi:hypothetical protein